MDYTKTTEIRIDIEAAAGEAQYSARLFEGIVTLSLSGTAATPSQLSIPHEELPTLVEFINHVLTEAPVPVVN